MKKIETFKVSSSKNLELVKTVFNEPFFKNRSNFFSNEDWIIVKLSNDYFIEKDNFTILQKLMELGNENDFLFTFATPDIRTPFYKCESKIDIEVLRNEITEGIEMYFCWYFLSLKKNWACISEYDNDTIFLGYDKCFHKQIRDIITESADFIDFLKY